MAGYPPGDFDVTALTATPQIVLLDVPTLFDLSVTFDGSGLSWDDAEYHSDNVAPINAEITWFLESIGPGPEIVVATTTEVLTVLPGGPYTASVANINPTGNFPQPDGSVATLELGVYRLQCKVDVDKPGPLFWTAYFSGDVLFRVAEHVV